MSPIAATDRLRRADVLLAELLDLPAGDRRAHLERVCADDPDLHALVEELLRLAGAPSAALDRGPFGDGPLLEELARELALPQPVEGPGSRIGSWRLVRELGRGGMGVVYLAERADGEFEQTAALKLLPAGADSDEVLRRFERERRILASLSHPGIARLLDGGRTADGRPFFVMERVEGRPIDRYCDEERLTIEERLELFLQVAGAVRHAHRNLVVHRDLKPSNVLVTAAGRTNLLDFGIAKPLSGDGDAFERRTLTAARLLTPEYASPEQVRGDPITTSSDVYQLGLLLYRLLTGRCAHRLTAETLGEIETAVCRRVPERPSDAVERRDREAPGRPRTAVSPGLRRRLRGDLDTIVMTALRKEPEERYPSVDALAGDVERHLAGRPIAVRRSDRAYRVRKFVQRHWIGLAAAAAVVLAVLGYAVTAGLQAREIERQHDLALVQADRADRVRNFLAQVIAARGDPETLDLAARRLSELEGRPQVKAEMLRVLGEMNLGFGRPDEALLLLREAVALDRDLTGDESEQALRSRASLAAALEATGHLSEAAAAYREVADALRRIPDTGSGRLAGVQRWRGDLARRRGDYEEAEESLREALAIRRRIDADGVSSLRTAAAGHSGAPPVVFPGAQPHLRLARAVRDLARLQVERGELAEAERLVEEALELERYEPGYPPSLAETLHIEARLRWAQGRPRQAERLLREALAVAGSFPGRERESVASIRLDRVRLLVLLDRLEEARAEIETAEARLGRHLGQASEIRVEHLHARAVVDGAAGDPATAAASLREGLAVLESLGLRRTPRWAELRRELARLPADS